MSLAHSRADCPWPHICTEHAPVSVSAPVPPDHTEAAKLIREALRDISALPIESRWHRLGDEALDALDALMAEREALVAVAQEHARYKEALQQITGCSRDQWASAAEIARCALGWPST